MKKFKLRRAQGECLGIGSRRRTRQAAKSHGEAQIADISVDVRMGKPLTHTVRTYGEYIAMRREPAELKHLSRRRKSNQPRFRE